MFQFKLNYSLPKRILNLLRLTLLLLVGCFIILTLKKEPTYISNFKTYNKNIIISDLRIEKCWFDCEYQTYQSIEIQSSYFTKWVLLVKYQPIADNIKILTDFSFEPFEDQEGYFIEESKIHNQKVYKKYYLNASEKIDENLPLIRAIEILNGDDNFQDHRPYWISSLFPNFMNNKDGIYPYITMMKISDLECDKFEQEVSKFSQLKKLNMIDYDESNSSKLKILQISDLHFGLTKGNCDNYLNCRSDLKTLEFINSTLINEKPNFIVINGDLFDIHRLQQINSVQLKSIVLKSLQPILKHKIPFIITFGDSELDYKSDINDFKIMILNLLSTIPYCYNSIPSDQSLHGKTNYNLLVYNQDRTQLALITILDSELNVLQESQINLIYRENPATYKLMFFHYPISQFRPTGKFKIVGGYNEKHPLISNTNKKFLSDIIKCGYNVLSVGHEHENDACLLHEQIDKSIWLCYSGIAGDNGETKIDYHYERRVRLFEIDWQNKKLFSWKRKQSGDKFDYQLIYS